MSDYRHLYPTVKSLLHLSCLAGVALLAVTVRYKPPSTRLCGRILRRLRAYVRRAALFPLIGALS